MQSGVGGPTANRYGDRDAENVRTGDTVNQGAAIGVPERGRARAAGRHATDT